MKKIFLCSLIFIMVGKLLATAPGTWFLKQITDAGTGDTYYIAQSSDVLLGKQIDPANGNTYFVNTTTSAWPITVYDTDNLGGLPATYYMTVAYGTSTFATKAELTAEEVARILADNDIATDTSTLRIDIDAEALVRIIADNKLSISTASNRTQIDINTLEIASIEASTCTIQLQLNILEAYTTNTFNIVSVDTTTLQANITAEESSRILADSNIGISTASIKSELDAEIAETNINFDNVEISTNALQADIKTEETARINADNTIAVDTTTLRTDLNTEISDRQTADTDINSRIDIVATDTTTIYTALQSTGAALSDEIAITDTEITAIGVSTGTNKDLIDANATAISTTGVQVETNIADISANETAISTTGVALLALETEVDGKQAELSTDTWKAYDSGLWDGVAISTLPETYVNKNDYEAGMSTGVSQILAGDNITIKPTDGRGVVTINSTGGGGTGGEPDINFNYNGDIFNSTTSHVNGLSRIISKYALTVASYDIYIGSATTDAFNIQFSTATLGEPWAIAETITVTAGVKKYEVATGESITIADGGMINFGFTGVDNTDPPGDITIRIAD